MHAEDGSSSPVWTDAHRFEACIRDMAGDEFSAGWWTSHEGAMVAARAAAVRNGAADWWVRSTWVARWGGRDS